MTYVPEIAKYEGDFSDLLSLLQMSMGMVDMDSVHYFLSVEKAKGTRYYVAKIQGYSIGLIGVWWDAMQQAVRLEPPQVIDFAVSPDYRRQGVGRALMEEAAR